MRKVTISLNDRDAKWLERNEKQITSFVRQQRFKLYVEGTGNRTIAKVAKALVMDSQGY